jgi:hypothetical protein
MDIVVFTNRTSKDASSPSDHHQSKFKISLLYTYWLAILSNPGLASPGIPCNEIGNP